MGLDTHKLSVLIYMVLVIGMLMESQEHGEEAKCVDVFVDVGSGIQG